ncbi:hypothetical protein IFM89_022414 [Coptis chinensis]|uniref:Pectinesterase catalytic domain-containing protein n=1 Tax=Coptis chinensis TaxID=261450 RepID=A0A835LWT3_9MAGN|nr:hypothetical protein IFM89_022414 [Coptis chinensis]
MQENLGVLVNSSVVVNPDGSGNFTTITDAVNAAPNNTNIRNGYFVIYIVAGIYGEYVNVVKNKMNLMMIGCCSSEALQVLEGVEIVDEGEK